MSRGLGRSQLSKGALETEHWCNTWLDPIIVQRKQDRSGDEPSAADVHLHADGAEQQIDGSRRHLQERLVRFSRGPANRFLSASPAPCARASDATANHTALTTTTIAARLVNDRSPF